MISHPNNDAHVLHTYFLRILSQNMNNWKHHQYWIEFLSGSYSKIYFKQMKSICTSVQSTKKHRMFVYSLETWFWYFLFSSEFNLVSIVSKICCMQLNTEMVVVVVFLFISPIKITLSLFVDQISSNHFVGFYSQSQSSNSSLSSNTSRTCTLWCNWRYFTWYHSISGWWQKIGNTLWQGSNRRCQFINRYARTV